MTDYESIARKLDAMAERVDGSPSITRFDVHYIAGKCEGLRIAAQTVRDIADQETEPKSHAAYDAEILREIENKLEAVGPDLIEAIDGLISAQTECKSLFAGREPVCWEIVDERTNKRIALVYSKAEREAMESRPHHRAMALYRARTTECRSVDGALADELAAIHDTLGRGLARRFSPTADQAQRSLGAIVDRLRGEHTDCGSVTGEKA